MTSRLQIVKVNSCLSPPVSVLYGVPQGTVRGLLLLLFCYADLINVMNSTISTIIIFGDYTKFYKGVQDCQLLQEYLNSFPIGLICSKWNLILRVKLF